MNSFLSFERSREDVCTVEMETVECAECDREFHREVGSEYIICSKKCLDDAKFAFNGED